jgi:diguanylate cyclase (GGDEF)-like protein
VAGPGRAAKQRDIGERLRVLRDRASLAATAEEQDRCFDEISDALANSSGPSESAQLLMCRARLHANQWETRKLVADALQAMELFDEAGEAAGALDAASVAAAHAACLGELSLASDLAMTCIMGLDAVEDDHLQCDVANRLAIFCHSFRNFDRAVEQFEVSLAAAERCGAEKLAYRALSNLAKALLLSLRLSGAPGSQAAGWRAERLAYAHRVIGQLAGGPKDLTERYSLNRLRCHLLYEQGHADEALVMIEGDKEDIATEEDRFDLALLESRCLRALGRPGEAAAAARRARQLSAPSDDEQEVVIALRELVAALQQAGEAGAALEAAVELIDGMAHVHSNQTAQVVDQVWARAASELERRRLEAQTAVAMRIAEEDALTRTGNRRLLERFLADPEVSRQDLALLMIDIDHFKQINDALGHEVGDHVLRALGQILATNARPGQAVVRYGGEEFLFLLPSVGLAAAKDFAERLRLKVLGHPWGTLETALRVTVSIGVSFGAASDWQTVLVAADRAMYAAKRGGRNRVRTSKPHRG